MSHLSRIKKRHLESLKASFGAGEEYYPDEWKADDIEEVHRANYYNVITHRRNVHGNMVQSLEQDICVGNVRDFALLNAPKLEDMIAMRNILDEAIQIIEQETFVQISLDSK